MWVGAAVLFGTGAGIALYMSSPVGRGAMLGILWLMIAKQAVWW